MIRLSTLQGLFFIFLFFFLFFFFIFVSNHIHYTAIVVNVILFVLIFWQRIWKYQYQHHVSYHLWQRSTCNFKKININTTGNLLFNKLLPFFYLIFFFFFLINLSILCFLFSNEFLFKRCLRKKCHPVAKKKESE